MLWLCLFLPSLVRGATTEADATAEADTTVDADALAEIATLALAFSPQVSVAPPAAVLVEISGSVRLFGGLTRLVERLTREVKARDDSLQTAIAPVPAAAALLARAADAMTIIAIEELPEAL